MSVYTVSFFGHRVIEDPLLIEQHLETLIRRLLKEKEYVEFLVGGMENLTSSCPLSFAAVSALSGMTTAPMFGYCHIQQQTSGTMRMPTGNITMKLKSVPVPQAVTSRELTKQGTGKW